MDLKVARQLFTLRDLRNAVLGVVVVFGGLGLSGLTLYAHQIGDVRMAAISASVSLVFVLLILIFIVPPLARNARRETSQMNLPFEFTTGGAVLLVLIVIVGFSAWNTGNNLLFLVLSFLLASMIVGFVAGGLCLKKLDVTMRFPETIFAGEKTPILVTMTNRKRLIPAFSVVVEVRGRERERSVAAGLYDAAFPRFIAKRLGSAPVVRRTLDHFVYVRARDMVEKRTEHVFPNRGKLSIRDFELSTKFPFGFFRHRRRLPAREAELLVFPKIVENPVELDEMPLELGKRVANKRGSGQDLLALRDYQPNDNPRNIDWKATARTSQLTAREYSAEDEQRVTVIFDTRIPAGNERPIRELISAEQSGEAVVVSPRFEEGARIAASLLSELALSNAEIRLLIDSVDTGFGAGRAHVHECLRHLASIEPAIDNKTEPVPGLARVFLETGDSHILLVTANGVPVASPDILQRLKIIGF